MKLKKIFIPHKNIKILYYVNCYAREILPNWIFRFLLKFRLSRIPESERKYLSQRINYYNKLNYCVRLSGNAKRGRDYKIPSRHKVYHFDFIEYVRYFNADMRINLLGGDVTHIPAEPTITKSRPIAGDNQNAIIMKLNKVRHFTFVKYDCPYFLKKDMLVWRGSAGVEHRNKFLSMYYTHPLCNIGNVKPGIHNDMWLKNKISINQHLNYKFILCIEGNDVATNLKWVMSSNSLVVMPKPKYETWFMEGSLIPDFHYIALKDDYSDLNEKINYYLKNPDKAQTIIRNAHDHVEQFKNKQREDLISLLVLEKFFVKTGQLEPISFL